MAHDPIEENGPSSGSEHGHSEAAPDAFFDASAPVRQQSDHGSSKAINQLQNVIPATPVIRGNGHGEAFHADHSLPIVTDRPIEKKDVEGEIGRFKTAIENLELRYRDRRLTYTLNSDPYKIVNAQIEMLKDPSMESAVSASIRNGKCAEQGIVDYFDPNITSIRAFKPEKLRALAADCLLVARDLLFELDPALATQGPKARFLEGNKPRVLVAEETPVELLIDPEGRRLVAAISSLKDGASTHAGILAKCFHIPMVTGVDPSHIPHGSNVLVSATRGWIAINPGEETLRRAQQVTDAISHQQRTAPLKTHPSVTVDGVKIEFFASVVDLSQTAEVIQSGAKGIGLFRSEMMLLRQGHFSPLEVQTEAYRGLIHELSPESVVIRIFDLGSKDKPVVGSSRQGSPAFHGLELALTELREEFGVQMKAIVRAAFEAGDVKILLPTVLGVDQILEVKKLRDQYIKEEIDARKAGRIPRIELGAMIETPAALLGVDAIAEVVDFLSVGTNDLVRTLLDTDRSTAGYRPTHPAVIRALIIIAEAAARAGKPVTVCGEMAGNREMLPLLVGAGYTRFSAPSSDLAGLNHVVRHSDTRECRETVKIMDNFKHSTATNDKELQRLHEKIRAREK